jgi:hypothetical protein
MTRPIKKWNLMLCQLHYIGIHGKTDTSDPNIDTHYIVYDRFNPITFISYSHLDDDFIEYDTDRETDYDSEFESNFETDTDTDSDSENRLTTLNDEITFLKRHYSNPGTFEPHPIIRNYRNIILHPHYIKAEIGEYIILPTLEAIAILKTFWLRIIQKKWKKVFQERKKIIKQRCQITNLSLREINYMYPNICRNLPGLKGMLNNLKNK